MFEDTVIIIEEDDERFSDDLCYCIQSFVICILISILICIFIFLYKMIETMTFKIKYQ